MSPSPLAWSLHSPLRFIAVLVGGISLLVAITAWGLRGQGSEVESRTEQQRQVAETQAAPVPSPTVTGHPDEEGESIGPAARRTVERFLKHYLAPTSRQEFDQLRTLCTPDLWAGLKASDPTNMPPGPAKRIEKVADGAFTATFAVELTDSSLSIDVVVVPDGLRVASVEPEEP